MSFKLKSDAPRQIKLYIKEMKSLCGSEEALSRIVLSNEVKILLKKYPGRKSWTDIHRKKNCSRKQEENQQAKCYWELLSHIESISKKLFNIPYNYRSVKQNKQQILKSICHINFQNLYELRLQNFNIHNFEQIASLDMPVLENLTVNVYEDHFSLKSFAKTKFCMLKKLQLISNVNFNHDQVRHLNRASYNVTEELPVQSQYEQDEEQKKQFRDIIKNIPRKKQTIALCVKIPNQNLDAEYFRWYSEKRYNYVSKALNIVVSAYTALG